MCSTPRSCAHSSSATPLTLRRVVIDKRCSLPDGFTAGVHPDQDKARFHVTERGITLITSSMLGERRY